ncbi:MAG: hypothetical protein PHN39_00450 [Candidatus Pacebacteria bacterium]|nr:hypothetical protein [Candidatus Paceibacterota bacterium]
MDDYNQKELLDLFEALPQELKTVIVSEKTSKMIADLAAKYELDETDYPTLASLVGYVLIGVLSPDTLAYDLTQEATISQEKAEALAQELIVNFFHPLKEYLSPLYPNIQFTPDAKIMKRAITNQPREAIMPSTAGQGVTTTAMPSASSGDTYREPVK